MIHHHPDEAQLLEFSAGTLSAPHALCVRLHLNACRRCRCQADMLDSIGAVVMDDEALPDLSENLFDRIIAGIDARPLSESPPPRPSPDPLRKLLGHEMVDLPWKKQLGDVSVLDITGLFPGQPDRIVLQKLAAGGRAPRHSHRGEETTVVVQGGFTDNRGLFEEGDFVILDQRDDHQPVALHGEDCITFSILSAPVRLTGAFLRLFNPFIR